MPVDSPIPPQKLGHLLFLVATTWEMLVTRLDNCIWWGFSVGAADCLLNDLLNNPPVEKGFYQDENWTNQLYDFSINASLYTEIWQLFGGGWSVLVVPMDAIIHSLCHEFIQPVVTVGFPKVSSTSWVKHLFPPLISAVIHRIYRFVYKTRKPMTLNQIKLSQSAHGNRDDNELHLD